MDQSAGGVRVLGTPSTCFQFKPDSHDFGLDITSPGYRTIDLYADGGIETQVVRLPEPLVGLQFNSQGY
jgi:Icc protein